MVERCVVYLRVCWSNCPWDALSAYNPHRLGIGRLAKSFKCTVHFPLCKQDPRRRPTGPNRVLLHSLGRGEVDGADGLEASNLALCGMCQQFNMLSPIMFMESKIRGALPKDE